MARKRMIDPSFWRDEKIGELAFVDRLIFIGLWNFADDNGVGRANPKLLKADIFPYDDTFRVSDFEKSLVKIATLKLITLYEVDNQKYYFVNNFSKHQTINRPTPSELPLPSKNTLTDNSMSSNGVLTPQVNIREDNIREDNLNKESVKNTHTCEDNSQKRFFDTHPDIQLDSYNGFISDIDFDLLSKCLDESTWLKSNITSFSWICDNYQKIIAGRWKDFKKIDKPKVNTISEADDKIINKGVKRF